MNIFYLDEDPKICAKYHFDTHVKKMIVESAQMLSTAHRVLDGYSEIQLNRAGHKMKVWRHSDETLDETLYKSTHVNHPCNLWIRESDKNYKYLYELFSELIKEFHYRFGKSHASERLLSTLQHLPENIPVNDGTPFKIAASKEVYIKDPVAAYRYYYFYEKGHLFLYTKRNAPEWYKSPAIS